MHRSQTIRLVRRGTVVICDRYTLDSIVGLAPRRRKGADPDATRGRRALGACSPKSCRGSAICRGELTVGCRAITVDGAQHRFKARWLASAWDWQRSHAVRSLMR
jgi:hypothetical protein